MLGPEDRRLFLDALRPPPGYELDQAVGTTYSLDLTSLLAAPLGFALFYRESSDGQVIVDPIALIEAVRRYADRVTVFCQAGQIAISREYRAIFTYLEGSVCEVRPAVPDAIFHPKVWVMRYVRPGDGVRSFRLLCLSRNLTFDRAWDTILRLDGEEREGSNAGLDLARFIARLSDLAVRPLAAVQRDVVAALARELRDVVFEPPEGFDRVAFWPMGVGGDRDPLAQGRIDRLLVISPFLTAGMAQTLGRRGTRNILISRPEAFDRVGATAVARYAETLVMNPMAISGANESEASDDADQEVSSAPTDEAIAERPDVELRGLHAKLYVADAPYRGRVWTGSANATDAAFGGNVEFMVELEGRKAVCGVDAFVGDRKDGVGLPKLLEPYRPANNAPEPPTEGENLERRLDLIRRRLAGRAFTMRIAAADSDTFALRAEVAAGTGDDAPGWWDSTVEDAVVRVRPLTLGAAYATPLTFDEGIAGAAFGDVTFERLTSFVVVDLELRTGRERAEAMFVVNAELVGAPADRRQRTIVTLLENRKDLIRFLLLLLGQIGADDLSNAIDLIGDPKPGQGTWLFAQWQSLLEPMVRALGTEPTRLDEIERLITELAGTDAGRKLLPPGWRELWDPIWSAREGLRSAEGSRR